MHWNSLLESSNRSRTFSKKLSVVKVDIEGKGEISSDSDWTEGTFIIIPYLIKFTISVLYEIENKLRESSDVQFWGYCRYGVG